MQTSILQATGPICPGCQAPLSSACMQVQLESQIRERISKYYEGWTVCDDPTCRNRTRMMSVYGRRCLKPGCKGAIAFEVEQLQLHLWERLWLRVLLSSTRTTSCTHNWCTTQVSSMLTRPKTHQRPVPIKVCPIYSMFTLHSFWPPEPIGTVEAIITQNYRLLASLDAVVQKYLSQCGRRYVDLGSLFSFMKV